MSSDDPDRELTELVDETRLAQAGAERSRERWLRQQAAEEARLSGLLLDAAERGTVLTVRTRAGRVHRGRVLTVGRDFCGLEATGGDELLVRFEAIVVMRPDPSTRATVPQDRRVAPLDLSLAELLVQLAPDQPQVALVLDGDREGISGRLLAVGVDVVTVATAPRTTLVYVTLSSVLEASLRASG
jgi:hypothetical protein